MTLHRHCDRCGENIIPKYYPRWLNWLYAHWYGYFWAPCPLCGQKFGGHETAKMGLMINLAEGKSVCRMCEAKAEKINEEFFKQYYQAQEEWYRREVLDERISSH